MVEGLQRFLAFIEEVRKKVRQVNAHAVWLDANEEPLAGSLAKYAARNTEFVSGKVNSNPLRACGNRFAFVPDRHEASFSTFKPQDVEACARPPRSDVKRGWQVPALDSFFDLAPRLCVRLENAQQHILEPVNITQPFDLLDDPRQEGELCSVANCSTC